MNRRQFTMAAGAAVTGTIMQATGNSQTTGNPFRELIEQSMRDKKGLTFYVKGQTIGGGVTRMHGDAIVEVRNQTHSRIVIRLDSVDAIAAI
ncbi:MAG: hypothetical protein ACRD8O_02715 [Bryobacteraceae bacterium]